MSHRIGIDAHMLGHLETGNETYIRELVRALVQLESDDEFFVFVEDESCAPVPAQARCHIVRLSTRSAARRLLFELPRRARELQLDLLHVTYNAPFFPPCPVVISIHDISYARHPEYFSARDRLVLNSLVPYSARHAHKVLTDTEFTKRDLIALYGLSPAKIVTTPYAAQASFRPISDAAQLADVRAKYQTSDNFILAVSSLQPRKNLARLIEAYARAQQLYNLQHKLVLVGPPYWKAADLTRVIHAHQLDTQVVMTGFVPEDDLSLLYNAATVFVYPSLYEGFGLPMLEAMACGTPVVAANASALPEVAGEAALLVDPRDTEQIAHALARVVGDRRLHAELKAKGLARAAVFSWRDTALKTLAVYHAV